MNIYNSLNACKLFSVLNLQQFLNILKEVSIIFLNKDSYSLNWRSSPYFMPTLYFLTILARPNIFKLGFIGF